MLHTARRYAIANHHVPAREIGTIATTAEIKAAYTAAFPGKTFGKGQCSDAHTALITVRQGGGSARERGLYAALVPHLPKATVLPFKSRKDGKAVGASQISWDEKIRNELIEKHRLNYLSAEEKATLAKPADILYVFERYARFLVLQQKDLDLRTDSYSESYREQEAFIKKYGKLRDEYEKALIEETRLGKDMYRAFSEILVLYRKGTVIQKLPQKITDDFELSDVEHILFSATRPDIPRDSHLKRFTRQPRSA